MAWQDRAYYGQSDRYSGGGGGGGGMRLAFPRPGSFTLWLLIANVAIFFANAITGRARGGGGHGGVQGSGLLFDWFNFNFDQGIAGLQVWRLIGYQYLHGDGWHLIGNMLWLFFFGSMVETFLGSKRFLGFWTLCGIAGALFYLLLLGVGQLVGPDVASRVPLLLVGSLSTPLVGASACVFGMLIAAWRVAPDQQVLLFFVLPVKLKWIVVGALLIELYSVITNPSDGGGAAHLGGAIAGAILMSRPGWLNPFDRVSVEGVRGRIETAKIERKHKRIAAENAEIDRILKKVSKQGLHSLTDKEKRTLQRATERKRDAG